MAIIRVKPGTFHKDHSPIQATKPRKGPKPLSIAEAYAKSVQLGRPPQAKAGQA